jgi:hypothetical protein
MLPPLLLQIAHFGVVAHMNIFQRGLPMYARFFPLAMLSCCLTVLNCSAQTVPQPDDPQLYRGALDMFSRMYQDSLAADMPEHGAGLRAAAAQMFGITSSDFSYLIAATASLRIPVAQRVPSNGSGDSTAALNDQIDRLSHTLSPSGWANFRAFVNGDFRAHTHILPAGTSSGNAGGTR